MKRAGLLNEIIKLYEPSTVINDYGEREETFVLKYTTRARVLNDGGMRTVINEEIVFPYNKSFQVRYYVPVTDTMQVEWQNKRYRIISTEKRRDENDIIIKTELINE